MPDCSHCGKPVATERPGPVDCLCGAHFVIDAQDVTSEQLELNDSMIPKRRLPSRRSENA